MSRNTRNTIILAKIETTSGTDAVPTGADNAILVSDPGFELDISYVDRNNIKGYLGSNSQSPGSRYVKLDFTVEISGSGAAGTAPAWGPLLRACAMAEVVTAASRVEYSPITSNMETMTIYYHKDGVLRKALGCKGNAAMTMEEGGNPTFKFSFMGLDGGETSVANPTGTFTAWKSPLAITNENTSTVTLGGAYATGAITGGTSYCSRGLMLDLGNDVAYVPLLGNCQGIEIRERSSSGSMQLELSAVEEVAALTSVKAATLTSLGFVHGSAAGATVMFFAPSVQRTNPSEQDFNGRVHLGLNLRLLPVTGNDELRIVAK